MITKEGIRNRRDEITSLAACHGAYDVRIFGSVARGEATETSDLDLLVRFEPDRSLMDHGMLIEELQSLLGIRVDVVSEGALSPQDPFGNGLAREAVPL
ncbi:MAG TPA: nucleotidyltransferase family protein [Tepidisphaeraceae bacterium]|nr:nucleotidyltransferase family protein [Tepidisphaeraceae bacterium]